MAKRDYYEVLAVSRTATDDQIKSAYRKLARKYHPDVNKAADASAKFREATEAYEALGDKQKRQMYDQFGHTGPGGFGPQGGPGPGPGGARSYTWSAGQGQPVDFEEMFGGQGGGQSFGGMSLEELLGALGGGRMGGRARRGRQPAPRGADFESEVTLDFLQAVRGTTATLRLQDPHGTAQTLNVRIPPGVHEGSKIRVRGKGAPGHGGQGDLYIVVHVREHPYFRREDSDIYVELPISIVEAALGAKVDVPTLDGTMTMTLPPGTASGKKLRLKGKGVSAGAAVGDQYVTIKIVPPPTVSPEAGKLLKQFEAAEKFDPRKNVPWK